MLPEEQGVQLLNRIHDRIRARRLVLPAEPIAAENTGNTRSPGAFDIGGAVAHHDDLARSEFPASTIDHLGFGGESVLPEVVDRIEDLRVPEALRYRTDVASPPFVTNASFLPRALSPPRSSGIPSKNRPRSSTSTTSSSMQSDRNSSARC